MTPGEIVNRLCDLDVLFQVRERHPNDNLDKLFGPPPKENLPEWENPDNQPSKEDRDWMDTLKDPKIIIKYNAWFLGNKPPMVFKGKITGRIMSCQIKDRNLVIKFEEVPWGLDGGIFKMNCEYITSIDYKSENGTLYISSKVGHVAIKVHEITDQQCSKKI